MEVSWSAAAAVRGACRCRSGGMTSSPASESLEHARFAVVDVETTGVRAQVGGRILEVAVAILEGGTVHLAFQALLDPGTPIPLWVARLTGITDGMVAGRPRFGDVVADFGRALDAAVFVAHTARFDCRFLAAEYALPAVPGPAAKPSTAAPCSASCRNRCGSVALRPTSATAFPWRCAASWSSTTTGSCLWTRGSATRKTRSSKTSTGS